MDGYLVSPRVDNPQVELDETVCLLSSLEHLNYGSTLMREIPKLLTLRRLGLSDLPVLSPATPWHRELLDIFGVKRIVAHDRHSSYRVSKLILPGQKTQMFYFEEDVIRMFDEIAGEISEGLHLPETPLVYVSRISHSKKHPDYRRCVNEEELVDGLLRLGFQAIEPESLSVREQVAIFRSARFVVGPSGAGMFNTLFCRPGTSILSLEPLSSWIWQHCNLFGSMGHAYGFVTGGAILDDPEPVQKSWRADIPVVLKRVQEVMRLW
jgi:capsular polysaccharide biosynthesis protein